MSRAAWSFLVAMAAALLASCGSDAPFAEDAGSASPIANVNYREEPNAFRSHLLVDPWVAAIKVGRSSTFGREIPRQVRIDIDGRGALVDRDVTLQTHAAVAMFSGKDSKRMRMLLHGMLRILDERGGFVRGFSFTTSRAGYEAAKLAGLVEQQLLEDDRLTADDKRFISVMASIYVAETTRHSLAWFDRNTTWITIGPDVSRIIEKHAVRPGSVTPAEGIDAASIIRHELEHAVTPRVDAPEHTRWLEEGGVDTLAKWPGAAAETARMLGLPYPKRYERLQYDDSMGGYPPFVASVRMILRAAGVDTSSADAFDEASDLLQTEPLDRTPELIADAIAKEQGLDPARRDRLLAGLRNLDGDPRATRRLVEAWL